MGLSLLLFRGGGIPAFYSDADPDRYFYVAPRIRELLALTHWVPLERTITQREFFVERRPREYQVGAIVREFTVTPHSREFGA